MKRLLTLAAMFLCCITTTFAQYSGSGTGTENDPYLIYNENQLSQVSNFLNQEGVVFKLMKDLDLTNWIAENNPSQGWLPIGVESTPFKGKFYGNNHRITGYRISRSSENNVGFFGFVDGATIQDLTLEGTSVSGSNYVGAFFGTVISSTISNLSFSGVSVTGNEQVGGFAGKVSSSTLVNCNLTLSATVGVTATLNVGGFVGYTENTTFTNFISSATVTATSVVGGFTGYDSGSTFQIGTVQTGLTVATNCSGGFIGAGVDYHLTNIKVSGDITNTGNTGYVGGIVAKSSGTVSLNNCSYSGDIDGKAMVAGVVGSIEGGSSAAFTLCHSKGKITNTGDYTGGVVGRSNGACISEMESCSHFGDIHGVNYVGGLIGAMLSIDVKPTLHTYMVRSSKTSNTSGTLIETRTETIKNGSSINASINNCTAIGNIDGSNWVGGLIGSDLSSYGYTATENSKTCSASDKLYLFKDGVYTGTYGYTLTYSYYDYARNSVSHSLTNNYYSGTIVGNEHVGGLVGQKGGGEIKNCYSYANIFGATNVGGVVGSTISQSTLSAYSITTLKSNVANCQTISATSSNIGRIYGTIDASYTTIGALGSADGNRALAQTKMILQGVVQEVEDNLQNGTSIGPSLLRLKATYVSMGWNFDENWNNLETECYPYKKYQAAPPVIESNLVSQATSISGQSLNGGTVYLFYKDREAVSTTCDGYNWTFSTDPLQSGALVQIYADVEDMTPSYFTTTTVSYPGSGTEDDPYRIYTAEDLQGASNRGYYKLMNDIDLTSWINENSPTEGWPAIGRNSGEATYIDGDGHKVTGLWMNTTQDYNGLFSNFSAGQIKNLTVEVATGKKVKGGDYTGILIGRNANGRIVNCAVKGEVEGTGHVGGVIGYAENTTISANSADVNVTGTTFVGGVAGQTKNCSITTCNTVTTIACSGDDSKVGGIVGYSKDGTISKCSANNTLTASGATNYVGGLVGYTETPVTLSFSTGSVTALGSNSYLGGLVGYALSPIENCYSTANTVGTLFTAALVGYTFSSIDKCYAKGNVNGVMYGGGVVGELDGSTASLSNSVACCNTLSLTAQSAWGSRVIGGFKNGAAEPGNTNYALNTMQVSLNNVPQTKTDDSVEGIAKTATELKSSNTYIALGWDFSEIWAIDEGEIFPYLLWEVDINPVADISFDKTSILLAVGKNETISANVLPLGATNKRLNWTSSNTAVATVADGVVTAVAVGTATITATSTDGSNISATCAVTVTANKDAAIAELQAIVDRAQSLYNNSTEGENIGQYAVGSRSALLTVINSVKSRISSTMSDETITQCTNEINAAIQTFQSQQVTAGEDTDISQIANTIYIERIEAAAGQQIRLSVKMKNIVEVQGYQFDLYLPTGVTIATDEDGFALAELSTARTTKNKTNYFDTAETADGGFRVLCGSSKGYTFSGNDGEVAIITLNIASDIAEGEHPIILKNVKLSDKESNPYNTDYLKSTLVISSYTLGDVNADGSIDVADFIAIANHILGKTPVGFVEKAADVNEDNSIDVADFIAVANIILHNTVASSRATTRAPRKVATNIDALDDVIYVEPVTAALGSQQVLSVRMKNTDAVAGFEFSLKLPEGITIAKDADDMNMVELSTARTTANRTNYFDSSLQSDGTLKVLCGTSKQDPNTGLPYAFSGNDGEIARITVNVASDITEGEYAVLVKNGIQSAPDASKTILPVSVETTLTIDNGNIVLDENSTTAPIAAADVAVRVKRTIKANEWSTICLPFAMTDEQVKEAFGDDVKLADFDGIESTSDADENVTNISVKFNAVTSIEANHPYLIKVQQAVSEFTVNQVDIAPSDELSVDKDELKQKIGGRWYYFYNSFIGTYAAQTEVPENSLFLSENKFWYSTGLTKMKGYRGYFDFYEILSDVDNASARISFIFGDETTGVETLNIDHSSLTVDAPMYNLAGQKVNKSYKGIVIQNGVKRVIK